MRQYDALIVGGGHNGLVCAFYLARAAMHVRVLERRHVVGGAAVTEEFAPGFRNSTASYTVSLLQPKVIADMRLHERGLRIVERRVSNFLPFADGYLTLGGRAPGRRRHRGAGTQCRAGHPRRPLAFAPRAAPQRTPLPPCRLNS
jgi:phytoene dehydrogenase-like protein